MFSWFRSDSDIERRLQRLEEEVYSGRHRGDIGLVQRIASDIMQRCDEVERRLLDLDRTTASRSDTLNARLLDLLNQRDAPPPFFSRYGNDIEQLRSELFRRGEESSYIRRELEDMRRLLREYQESSVQLTRIIQRIDNLDTRLSESLQILSSYADFVRNQSSHNVDVDFYLYALSFGLDTSTIPLRRFVPVRIYLSLNEPQLTNMVSDAVVDYLTSMNLSIADDLAPQTGSWWKLFTAKTNELVSQPEVVDVLERGRRAIEVQALDEHQARANRDHAEAAAKLIDALKDVPEGVLQIGSILLIKSIGSGSKPRLVVRTLTHTEMIFLEKNQQLMHTPELIFDMLARNTDNQQIISVQGSLQNGDDLSRDDL